MKKINTAHVNQSVFNFETDAYDKLQNYFDSIRRHYQGTDDVSEIVFDIESRAADIFKDVLGKNKTVITLEDVDSFIASMGTVAQMSQEDTQVEAPLASPRLPFLSKRLFRDPDNKIIAGVASGLSRYFSLDPVIIRLLFIIALFIEDLHGFGIVLYFILWFIIPEAKTSADKLSMEGTPVTLATLEDSHKSRPEDNGSVSTLARIFRAPFRLLEVFVDFTKKIVKAIVPVGISLTGFFIVLGTALAIAGLVFATVSLALNFDNPFFRFPAPELFSNPLYYLGIIAYFLVILLPLTVSLRLGAGMLHRRFHFSLASFLALFFVWIISLGTAVGVTARLLPQYASAIRRDLALNYPGLIYSDYEPYIDETNSQELKLANFTKINASGVAQVIIKQGSVTKVKVIGEPHLIATTQLSVADNTLSIRDTTLLTDCLFCRLHPTPVRVEVTLPALTDLQVSGTTRVTADNLNLPALKLVSNGLARTLLAGKVDNLTAVLTGSSRLNSLRLDNLVTSIAASGSPIVNSSVKKDLTLNLSGHSLIYYLGNPLTHINRNDASLVDQIDPQNYDLTLINGVVVSPTPTLTPAPNHSIINNTSLIPTYAKKISPTPLQ